MDLVVILPTFVAALSVALLIGWFKKELDAYNPIGHSSMTGVIKPHKGVAYFTIIMGLIFAIIGGFGVMYFGELRVFGFLAVLFGVFITLSQIPSLTAFQNVYWNEDKLDGPSRISFQMMRLSRGEMNWSDVVKVGLVKGPYHYLEDGKGCRIYWSRSYENYQDFEATVNKHCPELNWPKFELYPK